MMKATPKVNIEANTIPAIVDAPDDDDTKTSDPANIWSRGDRLRAKTATIHEADDLILKTSSPDRPRSAVEDFPSRISISSMKAVSNSSNQTATAAIIPSWPGGESSDSKTTNIATKPSRPDSALREETQVSMAAKEGSLLLTNHTSCQGVHKESQVGTHQSNRRFLAPWFLQDLHKFDIGQGTRICNTSQERLKMPKASCTMMCFLGTYAVGMTVAFSISVVVCIITTGDCQEIHNGRNASNFQEAQTRQTFFEANFFSDVEVKGSELSKQEGGCGCQEREQKLPPLLLGLHFLELVALGLSLCIASFIATLWESI